MAHPRILACGSAIPIMFFIFLLAPLIGKARREPSFGRMNTAGYLLVGGTFEYLGGLFYIQMEFERMKVH
jgi:hypothetical protein